MCKQAEETLKACIVEKCFCDWMFVRRKYILEACASCNLRRTPAKDEGEREKCGTCWRYHVMSPFSKGRTPCRLFVSQKCGKHNDYRHWHTVSRPTAPADDGTDPCVNFSTSPPCGAIAPCDSTTSIEDRCDSYIRTDAKLTALADEGEATVIGQLRYIADSPLKENGGFHDGAIKTAKEAMAFIATLQAALAEKEKEADIDAELCVIRALKIVTLEAKLKSAEAHANAVGDNNSQLTQQVSDLQLLNKELRDGRR